MLPPLPTSILAHLLLAVGIAVLVRWYAGHLVRAAGATDMAGGALRRLRYVGSLGVLVGTAGIGWSVDPTVRIGHLGQSTVQWSVEWALVPIGIAGIGLLGVRYGTHPTPGPVDRPTRQSPSRQRIGDWVLAVLGIAAVTGSLVVAVPPLGHVVAIGALYTVTLATTPWLLALTLGAREPPDNPRVTGPDRIHVRLVDGDGPLGVAVAAGILPGHRYIFLADSLVEHLSVDELDAVVAHEAAHHHLRHPLRQGATLGVAPLLALVTLQLPNPALKVALLLGGALLLVGAVRGMHRAEYAADSRAARAVSPAAMARALRRLSAAGLIEEPSQWGPWSVTPTIADRIDRLEPPRSP